MENTLRVRRAERGPKGVSQMGVARAVGMSFNRYWRIENGETEPTADERRVLARYFRCAATVLFPSPVTSTKANDGALA